MANSSMTADIGPAVPRIAYVKHHIRPEQFVHKLGMRLRMRTRIFGTARAKKKAANHLARQVRGLEHVWFK